jgi:hypothetical protein
MNEESNERGDQDSKFTSNDIYVDMPSKTGTPLHLAIVLLRSKCSE